MNIIHLYPNKMSSAIIILFIAMVSERSFSFITTPGYNHKTISFRRQYEYSNASSRRSSPSSVPSPSSPSLLNLKPFQHRHTSRHSKMYQSYTDISNEINNNVSKTKRKRKNDIWIEESFMEQPIGISDNGNNDGDDDDDDATIVQAVRTVIYNKDEGEGEDHNHEHQMMMGYLIHRQIVMQQNDDQHHSNHFHDEALINCNTINTNVDANANTYIAAVDDIDVLVAMIHKLYKHHLLLKQNNYNDEDKGSYIDTQFSIQLRTHVNDDIEKEGDSSCSEGEGESTSNNKSISSSLPYLIPIETTTASSSKSILSTKDDKNQEEEGNINCYKIEKIQFIQHLHEYSYYHRGTEQSRVALEILGILSKERNSFKFQQSQQHDTNKNDKNKIDKEKGRNIISHQKQIIPLTVVNEIMDIMNVIKANGWLSTNPDSVDGLPSLHLNLISGGKPLFGNDVDDADDDNDGDDDADDELSSFDSVISHLTAVLRPYLYDQLLPIVKELCGSTTVEISDVFLRNYGRNVQPNDDPDNETSTSASEEKDDEDILSNSRFGLSPHYDVFSSATSVIALDSTAATGQNGLYTMHLQRGNKKIVSSHAALKEFFPLQEGDGIIHSFDVLHGVDIDPNLDRSRTSLIIWFVDKKEGQLHAGSDGIDDNQRIMLDQPWLLDPSEDDDVKQFVLALASDCKTDISTTQEEACNDNQNNELYILSSQHGNAFALNSLAEICDDDLLSTGEFKHSKSIPSQLCRSRTNPFFKQDSNSQKDLARAFWFESSMRGNRVAQASLAHSLMEDYMSERSEDFDDDEKEEILITASTFFCMSSQQGYDVAEEALSRMIQIEYARVQNRQEGGVLDDEVFMLQPVVQTALVSLQSQ